MAKKKQISIKYNQELIEAINGFISGSATPTQKVSIFLEKCAVEKGIVKKLDDGTIVKK